jgi:prepilin-type N-terminal cleavage/methylation domain-containing protein
MFRLEGLQNMRYIMDKRGLTLIELLVVVVVISILIVAMGFSFVGWRERYRVESEIKKLHMDIMGARAKAIQRKTVFFVNMPAADQDMYLVYEDTNPSPNGDGVWQSTDTLIVNTTLFYDINADARHFAFSRKGMANPDGDIWFASDEFDSDVDYSCIELDATRINTGWWNGTACETK